MTPVKLTVAELETIFSKLERDQYIMTANSLRGHLQFLQREADGMREALVKVTHAMDTLIHEGVDRGKGHWPAWDDCARAVDTARAALNGPPQVEAEKGSDRD